MQACPNSDGDISPPERALIREAAKTMGLGDNGAWRPARPPACVWSGVVVADVAEVEALFLKELECRQQRITKIIGVL